MSGEMLKSKHVEVTMILDGEQFKQTRTIPEGTPESQWTVCQSIGDCLTKSIMYNTDIKDQFKQMEVK